MFRGRSEHNLDEKGRLAIPARFKEVLDQKNEDTLVITNQDGCLWAFTRDDWNVIEEKAASLPQFDQAAISYIRYFISGAEVCTVKNGRVTLSQHLRKTATLDKEVVLVGGLKRFEIWDRRKWEEEFQRAKAVFPKVSQALADLGI